MTRTHPHTGTLSPIRAAPGYPSDLADKIGVSRQILSYQLACQRRCGLDPDRGNRNGDRRNRRKGVFGVVHNLIFTAMMVFGFGIALLTTNFVAIVGFVSSVAMIELQVRVAEEPYLLAVHGDAYRDYVATVGRLIPGAGGPTRDDGADATHIFGDGDEGTFDLADGSWHNDTTGDGGTVPKLPDLILDIIASGGVLPRLAAQGYLPPELGDVLRTSAVAMRSAGSGA